MGHLYHFTPAVSSKKLWDTVSFSKGEQEGIELIDFI
jgi:hypothetical protein